MSRPRGPDDPADPADPDAWEGAIETDDAGNLGSAVEHRVVTWSEPGAADPPGWVDGGPTSGAGLSCAFCGAVHVVWVHPLYVNRVRFLMFGSEHTLPSFWALCDRCEGLYQAGDDDAAVAVMAASVWSWGADSPEDVNESIRQPLEVFRRADRGARRLT